jgi:hypothetical protein
LLTISQYDRFHYFRCYFSKCILFIYIKHFHFPTHVTFHFQMHKHFHSQPKSISTTIISQNKSFCITFVFSKHVILHNFRFSKHVILHNFHFSKHGISTPFVPQKQVISFSKTVLSRSQNIKHFHFSRLKVFISPFSKHCFSQNTFSRFLKA